MSDRLNLADEVRIAGEVAAQIQAAGVTEDDPDFAALLESETDVQARMVRILRYARHCEAQSKAVGEILAENRERRDRLNRKAEGLRNAVLWGMQEIGLRKLEAADLTASVGAPKAKVLVTDPAAIPDALCKITREPSKTLIAEALAQGPIAGAEMANGSPSLTVRAR